MATNWKKAVKNVKKINKSPPKAAKNSLALFLRTPLFGTPQILVSLTL